MCWLPGCLSACVTPKNQQVGLRVVVDGRSVHAGPAAFTVRRSSGNQRTESVVRVPGVGEILVEADHCRFVKADGGVSVLSIFEHAGPCAELRGDKLCFVGASFRKDTRIDVDGCADRNELFLDRVDDVAGGGIGPRTLIERCVPIAAADPGYLRVDDVSVANNDSPWQGLRLRHDGDDFGVCFLSGKRGSYRVRVRVEEAGVGRDVVVAGEVGDL